MEGNKDQADRMVSGVIDPRWSQAQAKFYASEQCLEARRAFQALVVDSDYDTNSDYFKTDVTFIERHLDYLSRHPGLELAGYLSNLKLMTRKRQS